MNSRLDHCHSFLMAEQPFSPIMKVSEQARDDLAKITIGTSTPPWIALMTNCSKAVKMSLSAEDSLVLARKA